MPVDRKRTGAQARAHARMMDDLEDMEIETRLMRRRIDLIPNGWSRAHADAPTVPPKEKLTLRLDRDMVDWYRNLGRGWQPRINKVLRAYMHAVISKEIEMKGDRDERGRPV